MIVTSFRHQPRLFDLAINPMPNELPGDLEWGHDFGGILGDHHNYWRERVAVAGEIADLAGHRVARDIAGTFDSSVRGLKRFALQTSLDGVGS